MTEREVDEYMARIPAGWRYRWCNGGDCAFLGCCNRTHPYWKRPTEFTKDDWERWKKRQNNGAHHP